MSDRITMVRTVRTCDDHQNESWADECLHCTIAALEKKLAELKGEDDNEYIS